MHWKHVQKLYLTLMLTNTLAASLIWGINTLFLLDAGLSNGQAFLVNAFFTVGMMLFEIPTGVIADTKGRRPSYLLGTITLVLSTALYYFAWQMQAGLWLWIITSILLGLGFTFFSGATEAWLVDALKFAKYKGTLEAVFSKGQIVSGIAMLGGSVAGGLLAQYFNIGLPYILRAIILGFNFVLAFFLMKDLGFSPEKSNSLFGGMKKILKTSLRFGLKKPSIRWVMLAAPFGAGAGIYAFYAMQPYLLELFGNNEAYGIAGLVAAIVAGAQIVGGFIVPHLKKLFSRRTTIFLWSVIFNVALLILIGVTTHFYVALGLMVLWGLVFAANNPVRQAYLNKLIPSKQRATVLSFDALLSSSGGVVSQPLLGRSADVWSYSLSFILTAIFQALALPFLLLAKKQKTKADDTSS